MAIKKYVSLTRLSAFLSKLKTTFAPLSHNHAISDLTDYTVDTALSETSTNPVQNKVINEEFEAVATGMSALESAIDDKADASHTHTISDVTDLANATQSTAGLLSAEDKTQLDYGGTPIVTAVGDGSVYAANVDGMTSFVVGMKVTIIPNITSDTTSPKLNINGLGEKSIRMPITYNTSLTSTGVVDGWLLAGKPVTVQWNGTYWITVDLVRTSAQYLYGAVPIANGGTGATTAEAALTNLGITATATELNYTDGVTSNIQTQLDGKAASDHNHDGEYVSEEALEAYDRAVYPITTSGDGAAYTATVTGIAALTTGVSFIMVPHTVSTTTMPTLNVNGLGAKYIRRRLSFATGSTTVGSVDYWLTEGTPVRVIYDGTFWLIDMTRPSGSDIYGTIPIASGGTGATNAADALTNLGVTATADELNYVAGVTSSVQGQLNGKASTSHTHDDRYYTEDEIDSKLATPYFDLTEMGLGTIPLAGEQVTLTTDTSTIRAAMSAGIVKIKATFNAGSDLTGTAFITPLYLAESDEYQGVVNTVVSGTPIIVSFTFTTSSIVARAIQLSANLQAAEDVGF